MSKIVKLGETLNLNLSGNAELEYSIDFWFRKIAEVTEDGLFTSLNQGALLVTETNTINSLVRKIPVIVLDPLYFEAIEDQENGTLTLDYEPELLIGENTPLLNLDYLGGDMIRATWDNINTYSRVVDPLTGRAYHPNRINLNNIELSISNISYMGASGTGVISVPYEGDYNYEISPVYYNPTGTDLGTALLVQGPIKTSAFVSVSANNVLYSGTFYRSEVEPRVIDVSWYSQNASSRTYEVALRNNLVSYSLGIFSGESGSFHYRSGLVIPTSAVDGEYVVRFIDSLSSSFTDSVDTIELSGFGDVSDPSISNLQGYWELDKLYVTYDSITDPDSGIYSAFLTVQANDLSETIVSDLPIVLINGSYDFDVPKNGKLYNAIIVTRNNLGLSQTDSVQIQVPAGFGRAGFGRSGFGR